MWMYNVISLKRHTSIYVRVQCMYASRTTRCKLSFVSLFATTTTTQFDALHFDQKYDVALSHWFNNEIYKRKESIRKMAVAAAAGNKITGEKENEMMIRETISNENWKRERKMSDREKGGEKREEKERKNRKAHKREVIIIMMMLMLRDDDTFIWWEYARKKRDRSCERRR